MAKRKYGFWGLFLVVGCSTAEEGQREVSRGEGGPRVVTEENPAELRAALDQGCANAAPSETFVGALDYSSPRTYNPFDCYKARVIDYQFMNGGTAGSGGVFVSLGWADAVPTTQSTCTNAWVGGYRFEKRATGVYEAVDMVSAQGTWNGATCTAPSAQFNGIPSLAANRFAVTARTAKTSSAPTRSFRLKREWPF